ncbi:MAG: DNA translocase FtsK [Acholeplasmataceae bacterium]
MKRKNNKKLPKTFKIPQIPKVDGILTKKNYASNPFVSPLFGLDVKDEINAPYKTKIKGDKDKKYDAFRNVSKLDPKTAKERYGKEYFEFDNVLNKDVRKKLYGVDTYLKDEEKKEVPIKEEKPYIKEDIKEELVDLSFKAVEDYEEEDNEIKIKTFPTNSNNFKVVDSFDEKLKPEVKKERIKPLKDFDGYSYPPLSLYQKTNRSSDDQPEWLLKHIDRINQTFIDHDVQAVVSGSKKGPTVTRFEVSLDAGVDVKRVTSIRNNIMMSLSSTSLRIDAPIPGKPYVGIEVPNPTAEIVSFGNIVSSPKFREHLDKPLMIGLGEDIDGEHIFVDIASMPHGLIAGATNSGKSVCVNTILVSLILKNSPTDLKLILIDPKVVELSPYNGLPHLVTPVITDPKMASVALRWVVNEMESRYSAFAETRSRDLKSYNEKIKSGFIDDELMPRIVIVIDELSDLMLVASQEVEDLIQRITQKARAAGIHLIVATQRPSVDVIRGTIKSNIPTRIAFKVSSYTDSTTILDSSGADQLLGRGDMLLKDSDHLIRLQGAYISNKEIDDTIEYIKERHEPNYLFEHDTLVYKKDIELDVLFKDAARYVLSEDTCSINMIQSEFGLGFIRAKKLVDSLEKYNIISPARGNKAREVLVTKMDLDNILEEID